MTDDHLQERIQAVLDGELNPESLEEFFASMDVDPAMAAEYIDQQDIDIYLRNAPHARAPERLAVTIMARLAQGVQVEVVWEELSEVTREAMLLTTSMVVAIMLPTMISATYMVMNYNADPKLLERVVQRTIALMILMIEALKIILEEVEHIVAENPRMATATLSLVPWLFTTVLEAMNDELGQVQLFDEVDT